MPGALCAGLLLMVLRSASASGVTSLRGGAGFEVGVVFPVLPSWPLLSNASGVFD